jgi:Nif-specific regulatory protein
MERFAGRYALLRPLGQGGMGNVWLALDLAAGTECAIKRLGVRLPRSERDSLRSEFELLTRVRHPAVVTVNELGFAPDGAPFYTMEYVPGRAADIELTGAGWPALFDVAARVVDGLEALHAAGIVHGDVKPSNLIVVPSGVPGAAPVGVRWVDFGLSALLDRERRGHRGTPGYAAPEIVRGSPLSVASDLYGLGATLFVLALRVAQGGAPAHVKPQRPPRDSTAAALALDEASVPDGLAQLIVRLLSSAPESRPRDAREVRLELARLHPSARRTLEERLRTEQLVGRGRELARLERWLSASGGAPILLLPGESGVGKSTLLRELAVRASLVGRTVVSLACARGDPPGGAARTLLLRLAMAAAAITDDDSTRAEARRRLDEGAVFDEPQLGPLVAAGMAWGQVVREHGQPVLLLVDDCELLDDLSRKLVRRMVADDSRAELRWVWTSASAFAEGDSAESLLVEAGIAERMPLGLLTRDQADALIGARLQAPPPPELAGALWTRCGGHPGLTVESLYLAARARVLNETESGLTLDREALDRLSLPEDFETACLARYTALPAGPRAAAGALAVWQAPIAPGDLARIEPAADERALLALRGAGLLVTGEDGRCALNPPALARGVLASLPEGDRSRMFRAALELPELPSETRFRLWRGAGDVGRALAEADRALSAGADMRLAVEAAELAVDRSPEVAAAWEARAGGLLIERGRYRQSLPHLERAVALAPEDPDVARRVFLLSGAYLRTGALRSLEELLTRALSGPLPDRERAMLWVNRSALHLAQGELEAAARATREGVRLAERSGDGEAEGLALLGLASVLLREPGGSEASLDCARRANEAYTRAGHDVGRLRAAVAMSHALWALQRHAQAEALCREALAEASRRDLRLAHSEIVGALGLLLLEAGSWTESQELQERALRLAIEEGWPGLVAAGLFGRLIRDALMGKTARALRNVRPTLRMVRRHQRYMETSALRAVATTYRTVGRTRLAERAGRAAVALADRSGVLYEMQWCRIEYGHLFARSGRWERARELWRSGWAEHPIADSIPACLLDLLIGRAEVREGAVADAERRLAAVEGWLQGHRAPYVSAHALQLRAELMVARANAAGAAATADAALEAFEALPAPADMASAALEFTRLSNANGLAARTPVGEWLHRAAAAFERVGDRQGRERALALAVDWHRRFAPAVARRRPDRDLLKAVARLLDSLSDLGQLTRAAMRLAVEQFDAERGVLLLAESPARGEPGADDLRPVVEHGAIDAATRDQALSYSREVVQRVQHSGGSLVIPDTHSESEALSHSMVELGLRSILCVPLFVESRVVGAVYLDDSRRPEAFGDAERALLEGFAHLLAVAIENSRGHEQVRRENEQLVGENLSLRREAGVRYRPQNFVVGSLAMRSVLSVVERAALTNANVLITGENGTGKELIARMLHHSGARALKPFVAVNCAAIVPTLLESELFGILPDVATGVRARAGRFVEADGGTLFLDEIGDMPVSQQAALLRVLQERSVTPVGGGRPVSVDVRVIAATNRDLGRRIVDGTFREDLYFRLNVLPIEMPPLRERKADIPSLAQHFVAVFAGQQEREVPALSPELMAVLMQSDWPGNVRELQNYIERLVAMTPGKVLRPDPLPNDLRQRVVITARGARGRTLEDLVAELEKRQVLEALDRNEGNQTRAARELGLTEQSLRYRLRKYALRETRRFRRVR